MNAPHQTPDLKDRFVTQLDVLAILNCSKPTLIRLYRTDPTFPAPIRINHSRTVFRESSVLNWMAEQERKAEEARREGAE